MTVMWFDESLFWFVVRKQGKVRQPEVISRHHSVCIVETVLVWGCYIVVDGKNRLLFITNRIRMQTDI